MNSQNFSNYYNVFDHETYVSLAERSTKIVTAIYMVTDFLDERDPIRHCLRETITDVMRNLHQATHMQKQLRVETLSAVHNNLLASISYLGILLSHGSISDMNHSVINKEMNSIGTRIADQIKKSMPYDKRSNNTLAVSQFSFREDFFANDDTNEPTQSQVKDTPTATSIKKSLPSNVKDIDETKDDFSKTSESEPVFVKKPATPKRNHADYFDNRKGVKQPKKKKRAPKVNHAKEERKENILKILKQKRDASINDICALFKDCSSKTIQRDLNELISEGLVAKEGSRRWSKYNLSY